MGVIMKGNKKILFGNILAVFLMLMMPVNSAVESNIVEGKQTMSRDEIIEKQIMNKLSLILSIVKIRAPEHYDTLNELITDYQVGQRDNDICAILFCFIIIFIFTIIGIGIAMILHFIYEVIGCYESNNECYSCLLEEIFKTKILQSN